jgi:HTH-type transcriptional regulator/antitoxin MqsA
MIGTVVAVTELTEAGEIPGGGPRAFQKYESGEILVNKPMAQLLRLLDRDSRRLKELGD